MRAVLRRFVPLAVRRRWATARRHAEDRGVAFAAAREDDATFAGLTEIVSLSQPIFEAPRVEEKRANLDKAIGLMQGLRIEPGEVFSFWALLGEPSEARGWAAGRTIINDVVSADAGGGLCQLSGLAHHLGVLGGLTIVERWSHSVDLYQEHQRFMPLGLDATVVYGFKDLRLRNDGGAAVWLRFALSGDQLSGSMLAQKPIQACSVDLERVDDLGERMVTATRVWPDGRREALSRDIYRV